MPNPKPEPVVIDVSAAAVRVDEHDGHLILTITDMDDARTTLRIQAPAAPLLLTEAVWRADQLADAARQYAELLHVRAGSHRPLDPPAAGTAG